MRRIRRVVYFVGLMDFWSIITIPIYDCGIIQMYIIFTSPRFLTTKHEDV